MIMLSSEMTGKSMTMKELRSCLEPVGFELGGGWDYDHGYMDHQLEAHGTYLYVRIPFKAKGEEDISSSHAHVEIGEPFLLNHEYQDGLDDFAQDPNPLLNQFSEPKNKDGAFPESYVEAGKAKLKEAETAILH
ncbi:hypothetical protein FLK61_36510 [Paenalkalicoccus suaedae]|uniref:YugN-like family protein n=1 Tax=Paenalkalicoccus suaedae TaxID=2592382 RepID=A0A859FGJ3_9BACI|nr:YugN family protein [Paenalkalicoccus suaedae]QKS72161.1 hypothetical protein FLK61_36510 [Paenalkalicoccus suaedae]